MKQIGRGWPKQSLQLGLLAGFILLLLAPMVALADNVVQGYDYQGNLSVGEVVSLSGNKNSTVQAAPGDQPGLLFGVVVDPAKAPLYLSGQGNQVYVATAGTYPVIVDTQNGPIHAGDYLSISSTAGVAAAATSNQQYVLGQATQSFDGTGGVIGHIGSYAEGKVNINIAVAQNKQYKNTVAVPQPLQKAFNTLAGKDVPPFKIYSSLIILVIATTLTLVLLVVGIRSGMIAIGRNPLSRHYILEGLFQVIAAGLTIFISSLLGVYLLLKL